MSLIYLDFEFNGESKEILSLGLVRDDPTQCAYFVVNKSDLKEPYEPWVAENVVPYLFSVPKGIKVTETSLADLPGRIEELVAGDESVQFIADWPEDIALLNRLFITGPGEMINIPSYTCHVARVDSWPNNIEGLVQHNALADALALWARLNPQEA
jgi:hypothetical protein